MKIHYFPLHLHLMFLLLVTGCASKGVPHEYFTLSAADQVTSHSLPLSLGIAPVSIPGWLDQTNLIWSDGGVLLHSDDNARWGEPLANAITRTMLQNFSRYFADERISTGPWGRSERPERIVEVNILSIERRQNQLLMEVKWALLDKERRNLTGRYHTFSHSLNDQGQSAEFVQGFSVLIHQMVKDIAINVK